MGENKKVSFLKNKHALSKRKKKLQRVLKRVLNPEMPFIFLAMVNEEWVMQKVRPCTALLLPQD